MTISSNIHTGPWIDYTRGPVYGATITLTDAQATALVSFLAVLITHTGASSFKILRYTIHQLRTHPVDSPFIHRQNLLLTNAETDIGMFTSLLGLCHRWRRRTLRPWRRSAVLLMLVLVHALAFIAAGIAVSFVADGKDAKVLAKGEECGYWTPEDNSLRSVSVWQKEQLKAAMAAQAYKRLCYGEEDEADASECRVLAKRRLQWKETHNTTCPFKGMCLEGETAAYTLDTGLQSSEVLGINTAYPLQFQARSTCAPINLEPYTSLLPGAGTAGEDIWAYSLGPIGLLGPYTHTVSTLERALRPGLTLNIQTSTPYIGNGTLQLHPIPEISLPHADTTLLFISTAGITFHEPIDDPIFSAHNRTDNFTMPGYESFPGYLADHPVTLLACASNSRLCNPRTNHCTPFTAALEDHRMQIVDSNEEYNVVSLLWLALLKASIYLTANAQRAPVLAINDLIYASSADNLAREQWKLELAHLFELSLASAQLELVQVAKGSWPQERKGFRNVLEEKEMGVCSMVAWREDGWSNVSVFGLVMILVGCCIVILLGAGEGVAGRALWRWAGLRGRRGVVAWRRERVGGMGGEWLVRKGSYAEFLREVEEREGELDVEKEDVQVGHPGKEKAKDQVPEPNDDL